MNKNVIGGCAMSLALLAGCTDLVVSSPSPGANADGFVYSLPMGQVYLQAARKKVTATDIAKAKKAVDDAQTAVDNDKSAVTAAQTAKDADKTASAQAKQKQDEATLDQAKQTAGSLKLDDVNETVSLAVLDVVADPSARYVGRLSHDITRDDSLKLSIVKGLLNTSTVTSVDQTPNIIVTLADTAITIGADLYTLRARKPTKAVTPACSDFSYAWIFNPLDKKALSQIKGKLDAQGASFDISVTATPAGPQEATQQPPQLNGLVYRTAMPVVISVEKRAADAEEADRQHEGDAAPQDKKGDAQKAAKANAHAENACSLASSPPAQAWQVIVPDTSTQYVASSKAGPFTTTTLTYGFTNGMLTDYTMQRPSELAAIAGIPVRIANDIMTIPTQVLQMRVNYDTASVARINGDASVKAAQIQQAATLATAETAVVNAQAALESARIGAPTSIANAQTALAKALEQLREARTAGAPTNSTTASQ